MSAEFEKVVLEKLKVLDELNIKVDQISKDMSKTKEIVCNHTTLITNLSDKVNQLEVKVDSNTASISSLTEKVDSNTTSISSLTEKVDSNTTSISSLTEKVDNNTTSISSLTEKVDSNTTSISSLTEKVDNNTTLINALTKDVLDTQDIIKIQGQNLAKFEHDCMLKLNTLFDSFVANSDSHAVFSKFIAQLNAESFDYRQRISKLEDYFRNSKILATN